MLGTSKFTRIALVGALIVASISVANGAISLNSGTCVKSELVKSAGGTVYFANNSSKLTKSAKKALDKLATAQKSGNVVKVEITGFVSAVGPSSKHKSLATARAKSVRTYLESQGFTVEFVTKGVGVTSTKSTSSKARKATIQFVDLQQVETGGQVPQVKMEQSASIAFIVGQPVSMNMVSFDPATKADTANPTTLSISPDLPKGLSMDNKTGLITGTPTEENRVVKYTITAKNNCGSNSVSMEMGVAPATEYFLGGFTRPPEGCTPPLVSDGNGGCEISTDPDMRYCNPNSPGASLINNGCDGTNGQGGPKDGKGGTPSPDSCQAQNDKNGNSTQPADSTKNSGCDGTHANSGNAGGNSATAPSNASAATSSTPAAPTADPIPTPTYNGKSDIITKK